MFPLSAARLEPPLGVIQPGMHTPLLRLSYASYAPLHFMLLLPICRFYGAELKSTYQKRCHVKTHFHVLCIISITRKPPHPSKCILLYGVFIFLFLKVWFPLVTSRNENPDSLPRPCLTNKNHDRSTSVLGYVFRFFFFFPNLHFIDDSFPSLPPFPMFSGQRRNNFP